MNITKILLVVACIACIGAATTAGYADTPTPAPASSASPQPGASATTVPTLAQGMIAFYNEDWPAAISTFQQIVNAHPHNTMAWFYLFDGYIKRNDLRTLSYNLEEHAIENKTDAMAQAVLGLDYVVRYMTDQQVAMLDEAH